MKTNEETAKLLRDTLERYVKDLAEELLYWVEQLNKIDAGESPISKPPELPTDAEADGGQWPPRRRSSIAGEGSSHSPGKGA